MIKINLYLLLILAVNISKIFTDLPIHVTISDVIGVWSFTYSEPSDNWVQGCGSTTPNRNTGNLQPSLSNYTSWIINNLPLVSNNLVVELSNELLYVKDYKHIFNPQDYNEENRRIDWRFMPVKDMNNKIIGSWTTVYDEGIQININDMIIFGYMKYDLISNENCIATNHDNEDPKGSTLCYQTNPNKLHMGWYYMANNYKKGCIYGDKENINKDEHIIGNVVEVKSINTNSVNRSFNYVKSKIQTIIDKNNNRLVNNWTSRELLSISDLMFSHIPYYMNKDNTRKLHRVLLENRLNGGGTLFIETNDRLLSDSNDKSGGMFACKDINPLNISKEDLPFNYSIGDPFTNPNFIEEPINQGNCGSCYSISSIYALQKRYEILAKKMNIDLSQIDKLSSQAILSCSMFNQGCSGGYPFLVGKQINEIGIPSESCMKYYADDNYECLSNNENKANSNGNEHCNQENMWYAKNYGYVGGCYGCNSEVQMMNEIYKNGPIIGAFHINTSLLIYNDGIFDLEPNNHYRFCDSPGKNLNGWEYTNHAIVILGWGEDKDSTGNKIPYWIIRNSWGNGWGRKGYGKIKRGVNLGGIENQAVFIDPDITRGKGKEVFNNHNNVKLQNNIDYKEKQSYLMDVVVNNEANSMYKQ